jgi:hypothetical protein
MRTARSGARAARLALGSLAALLLAGLAACGHGDTPVAPAMAGPVTETPAAAAPIRASVPPTPGSDADLAAAIARDAAVRADREQTLRVQQQLREQQRARQATQADADVRCLAGQRMRRVANGWVQAGTC